MTTHFEKMLYDNALLLRAYAHLWRATGAPWARSVALDVAEFLLRDLRTPQGAFASALDADSPDEHGRPAEGAHYVWTPRQLEEVLGERDGRWAAEVFGVTAEGTFEHGTSVLRLADPEAAAADPERFARTRAALLAARVRRPAPERDDKVVAAWNGLAIAALADAGVLFERPDLVEAAVSAADVLLSVHLGAVPSGGTPGGATAGATATPPGAARAWRLVRTSRDGRPGPGEGVLEDYADVAEGFLALYAATSDDAWLTLAGVLLDVVLTRFSDPDSGGFHDTADDAPRLFRRPQDPTDTATPSGWTAAAGALLSYSAYTGSQPHRDAVERALGIVRALGARAPRHIGWGLAVAEALLDGPREIAVVGPAEDELTGRLRRTALLGTAPGAVVAVGDPAGEPAVPLLRDRPLLQGRPAAYVCRGFTCRLPTSDPAELAAQVGAVGSVAAAE
ncbi:uncharacterized protein YyaL (SSP411 family) [Allostreptomyces psammosilenae]|uniref:Uncharacterized protein YyaL (SSP411 family) n=1 Tax=Allostreptomyces psammosilenae TaxID=1892865 RepID=A0A852ZWN4_9ACTN|nr:uncharacterized protein YyaL (SSP411 family) [Allostreptomyces psammosilenae]